MTVQKTRKILDALFPILKLGAKYSAQIQARIAPLPDKDEQNFFAQALTAADLTIQALVETVILAEFPELRFFGEEHEKSHNTVYFKGTDWGSDDELLLTLDPIDGTRYFCDKHDNYQIIIGLFTPKDFEAALLLSPRRDRYFFAVRGEGVFTGTLEDISLASAKPWQIPEPPQTILLSSRARLSNPQAIIGYQVLGTLEQYTTEGPCLMGNDLFFGKIAGVVYDKSSLIDAGVLTFMAREAGFIVTDHSGAPLPAPGINQDLRAPSAIIAHTPELAAMLIKARPASASPDI